MAFPSTSILLAATKSQVFKEKHFSSLATLQAEHGPERVKSFRAQIFSFPCLRISTRRFMCNEFPITDLHQLGCQSACLSSACLHLPMFSLLIEAPSPPRSTHKSMQFPHSCQLKQVKWCFGLPLLLQFKTNIIFSPQHPGELFQR